MQTASLVLGTECGRNKEVIADWENGTHTIMGRKCALTLHSCISVTDNIKISELKKSIATGPLYIHTEFETNWTLLPEDVAVSNPIGNQVS